MARRTRRPAPTAEHTLAPVAAACAACGHHSYPDDSNSRTVTALAGVARYTRRIGRCRRAPCDPFPVPFRPEAEGRMALPHHEFGLDVIAYAGTRRYTAHRTAPEIHAARTARGMSPSVRTGVRTRWDGRIRERDRLARQRPDLSEPPAHVAKVGRSYEPDLPRTNNDREQLFGSHRHHERRCRGRKVASPGRVVRGGVRRVAGPRTRLGEATAEELAPATVPAGREWREELGYREAARTPPRRFRRDPANYLKNLEALARQSGLPA